MFSVQVTNKSPNNLIFWQRYTVRTLAPQALLRKRYTTTIFMVVRSTVNLPSCFFVPADKA
jgi:hypothetical protein